MNSLYQISDELLSIFNEIEANEGEVNEEQLAALEIAEEQLHEKLVSYKRAIRVWEADINSCKEEEKRIKAARNVKENRINKLKDGMLLAVQRFGYEGKPNKKGKTNKFYELSDGRLFTRTTESVELDENRLNILNSLLPAICSESYKIDSIDDSFVLINILTLLNEQLHLYYEGQPDFTITDLNNIRITYTDNIDIIDFIAKYNFIFKNKGVDFMLCNTEIATDKQQLKLVLNDPDKELTIAKIKETESLTIK